MSPTRARIRAILAILCARHLTQIVVCSSNPKTGERTCVDIDVVTGGISNGTNADRAR